MNGWFRSVISPEFFSLSVIHCVGSSDYLQDNFGFLILLSKLLVCECVCVCACAMSPCHAHNRLSLPSLLSPLSSQGFPGPLILGRQALSRCGNPVSLSNPGSGTGVAHQPGPAILVFMYFIGFRIFPLLRLMPIVQVLSVLSPSALTHQRSSDTTCRIQ